MCIQHNAQLVIAGLKSYRVFNVEITEKSVILSYQIPMGL